MKLLRSKIICITVAVLAAVFAQAQTNTITSLAAKAENSQNGSSVDSGVKSANATLSEKESMTTLRKNAEGENADAQFELGQRYMDGDGVATNAVEAVKWWLKAAQQGHAAAQFKLGICYANGSGVEKDETEAVEWCRKAAEQGFSDAQYMLGVCYGNGSGVKKDEAEAVEWYRKAAEQGYAPAQYAIG